MYKGISQGNEVYIDKSTGKLVKTAISGTTKEEDWAKSFMGVTALYTGYNLAASKAKDGYSFNEMKAQDGGTLNIQAMLGPLALHSYIGDLLYRYRNGMNLPKGTEVSKQIQKLLIGTDLRAQGPIGNFVEAAYRQDADYLVKGLADIGASLTYPAAVIKDAYGQADPSFCCTSRN